MPDVSRHENDVVTRDVAVNSKNLDAWTAHRTETGAVYYYNALTGVSTYEKPAGFKGEVLITKLLALSIMHLVKSSLVFGVSTMI